MQTLLNHPDSPFRPPVELKYSIDSKGTVIFTLPSGGTVRDTGSAIHFSAWDNKAKIMAGLLAHRRLAQTNELTDNNSLKTSLILEPTVTQVKSGGLSR